MLAGGGGSRNDAVQIQVSLTPPQSGSASRCLAASQLPRKRESTFETKFLRANRVAPSRVTRAEAGGFAAGL